MVAVFAVVALVFAVVGGLFLVQGALGAFGVIGTGVGVGAFEMVLAALPFYGAYLFVRVALRVRRQQTESTVPSVEARKRRHEVHGVLAFTVANIVGLFALPLPGHGQGSWSGHQRLDCPVGARARS